MKKVLSLILAAALVIGFVPATFAADVETGNGNEWVFSVGQHNVSEETLAAGNFNSEYGISKFNGTVSDAWGFVNIGGGSEYDPEVDHILYEYNLPEIKSIPEPDSSYAIALELDPDTSGTFNPTITVITETTAPIYEVYLMEKPANSSISVD
ncbi:MAG: hypothetical protein IJO61_08535, partial [Oscillospiraceae bacterium]|nr:hypothetical protein [Oscillospiraceae bacterium]